MFPYLLDFTLFGRLIRVPSYGVFLAMAFGAAYFDGIRRTRQTGEKLKDAENLFIIIVLSSVIGSRMFHVFLEEWPYYRKHPSEILAIWQGGYTLYGAMIAAMISITVYCRINKLSFLCWGDIAAPGTGLGICLGRLGCFMAGCCWGKPTDLFWGVKFTHPETFAQTENHAVHPSQLYESFLAFGIYLLLNKAFKKRAYDGQICFYGIVLYAVVRFTVEAFRGDDIRGYIGILSYSQCISLGMLVLAIVGWNWQRRRMTSPAKR